ncbi:MAG: FIST C-terminal domain-containing protein [Deltaproteobacteria bacterium]|nr:FIST C-terminal domain-containing protein [Deltaproteobacteria bacterium]
MYRIITASTDDLENPQGGIDSLANAIAEQGGLLENSVAIVMCPLEYVNSGFCSLLYDRLDIPILGATTSLSSTDKEISPLALSLFIISSDTLDIRVGLSDSLTIADGEEDPLRVRYHAERVFNKLYNSLTVGLSKEPALVLPFMPVIYGYHDEGMAEAMFKAKKAPFFGAMPVDYFQPSRHFDPCVIFGNSYFEDRAALLVLDGEIKPKFFFQAMGRTNIARQKAIITKSQGSIVYEVNGNPFKDFITSMGLVAKNIMVSLNTNPIIVYDPKLDKYSPRVASKVLNDNGYVFNGPMPQGSTLSVRMIDEGEIFDSAKEVFSKVTKVPGALGALFFSCYSRQLNLSYNEMNEIKLLSSTLEKENIPWLFAYSGGEFCPREEEDGTWKNRFLNLSAVAMVLQEKDSA